MKTPHEQANELVRCYGAEGARREAERRMQEEIEKGDVRAAGLWFGVVYELTHAPGMPG